METIAPQRVWTEKELMAVPADGNKYELVEGELHMSPGAGFEHEDVISNLLAAMKVFVRQRQLGWVLGSNLGCWMKNKNMRLPDLSFVSRSRLAGQKRAPRGFFQGSPDLVVEVLSPSDSVEDIHGKMLDYFDSGAKLAWVINSEERTVLVYHSSEADKLLRFTDQLEGENVLPGFTFPVKDLFAGWEMD